jgi:mycothiol synthase
MTAAHEIISDDPALAEGELVALARRCWQQDGGLPLAVEPWFVRGRWFRPGTKTFTVRGASSDDATAGTLLAAIAMRPGPRGPVITGLVDPAIRGSGTGSRLLDATLALAAASMTTDVLLASAAGPVPTDVPLASAGGPGTADAPPASAVSTGSAGAGVVPAAGISTAEADVAPAAGIETADAGVAPVVGSGGFAVASAVGTGAVSTGVASAVGAGATDAVVASVAGSGAAEVRFVTVETEGLSPDAEKLFESRGLRQFFAEEVMRIDLAAAPVPEPTWPAGTTLAEWSDEAAARFFQVYAASFRERPGFPDPSAEEWIEETAEDDDFQPEMSLLATLPEIGDAGFVSVGDNWIQQVGVVPAARRTGLGGALIRETLRRMASAGSDEGWLCVNVDNPAASLYRRIGFTGVGHRARYRLITP